MFSWWDLFTELLIGTLRVLYTCGSFLILGRFTPEILGETISSGLGTIVLEVLLLKLGFYLLAESNFSVPLLDLVANSSYIFVGYHSFSFSV